jgi:membrane protease YdiL (CAAX protease family)
MPIVIVGGQIVLNGQLDAFGRMAANPTSLALTAWGIGAYMLMLSAFQTLNNEGQALWMLYTYPKPIEDVLRDKAQLWGVLALVYPAALLAFGAITAHAIEPRAAVNFAIVVAGIPVFSAIAVALGVFACDPLAQDARTRVRPSYIYLYMLLASMYGYAIYAEKWFQAVVVMVLTAGLAQALWQKARDALPYLLDPAAAPPARVSTADGMMAAMLFFVLQALGYMLFAGAGDMEPGKALLLAFLMAGAVVYCLVRYVYWRSKTAGVPPLSAGQPLRSVGWGVGVGVVAAGVGLAYLHLVRAMPWFAELGSPGTQAHVEARWLLLLAVVLAPLFEEFIFRGLVFGGLRRSIGLVPAMALSAALFAIVHPPMSMLPVFVLGLCTAWLYDRRKGLLAPMLAHAVYNAIVLGSQM